MQEIDRRHARQLLEVGVGERAREFRGAAPVDLHLHLAIIEFDVGRAHCFPERPPGDRSDIRGRVLDGGAIGLERQIGDGAEPCLDERIGLRRGAAAPWAAAGVLPAAAPSERRQGRWRKVRASRGGSSSWRTSGELIVDGTSCSLGRFGNEGYAFGSENITARKTSADKNLSLRPYSLPGQRAGPRWPRDQR